MQERRIYRRAPASRQLEIRPLRIPIPRAPWEQPAIKPETTAPEKNFGRLIDIGCGGIAAIFNQPVEVGLACVVRISGPSGKIQAERGSVRTLIRGVEEGNRVGFAFDDPINALGDVKRLGPKLAEDYDIRPLVLIVDDEPDVRNTLDRFLTRRGLRVLRTGDANQALAAIELEPPLLMLLDLKMPEVTGIQMLEAHAGPRSQRAAHLGDVGLRQQRRCHARPRARRHGIFRQAVRSRSPRLQPGVAGAGRPWCKATAPLLTARITGPPPILRRTTSPR